MDSHCPLSPAACTASTARAAALKLSLSLSLSLSILLVACNTTTPTPPPAAPTAAETVAAPVAPTVTRGEFTLAADKLDTWNAVGQIVVRTPGATYEGRAQMMDLYSVRYRGEPFLVVTRALVLSDTVRDTTTLVSATTPDGKPIDTPASADLLAVLHRELPAEIARVRATQAAERKAKIRKTGQRKPNPPTAPTRAKPS